MTDTEVKSISEELFDEDDKENPALAYEALVDPEAKHAAEHPPMLLVQCKAEVKEGTHLHSLTYFALVTKEDEVVHTAGPTMRTWTESTTPLDLKSAELLRALLFPSDNANAAGSLDA